MLEIASKSAAPRDLIEKRERYAQIGVGEYWRFDGSGGEFYSEPLVGEYLLDGESCRFEVAPDAEGHLCGNSLARGCACAGTMANCVSTVRLPGNFC